MDTLEMEQLFIKELPICADRTLLCTVLTRGEQARSLAGNGDATRATGLA